MITEANSNVCPNSSLRLIETLVHLVLERCNKRDDLRNSLFIEHRSSEPQWVKANHFLWLVTAGLHRRRCCFDNFWRRNSSRMGNLGRWKGLAQTLETVYYFDKNLAHYNNRVSRYDRTCNHDTDAYKGGLFLKISSQTFWAKREVYPRQQPVKYFFYWKPYHDCTNVNRTRNYDNVNQGNNYNHINHSRVDFIYWWWFSDYNRRSRNNCDIYNYVDAGTFNWVDQYNITAIR